VRERRDLRNGIVRTACGPRASAPEEISLDRTRLGWRDIPMRACLSRGLGAVILLAVALGNTGTLAADPPPLHIKHGYDIKGLVLWITADDGVTVNAQGQVTQLVDKTGNFTLTPPNGVPGPAQVPKALNGHAVLRFNGSQSLFSADGFGTALDHALTFIVVAKGTAPADAEQFLLYLGPNAEPHYNRSICHFKGKVLIEGQFVGCYGGPVLQNAYIMDAGALNSSRTSASFYRNGRPTVTSRLALENGNVRFEPVSDGVTLGAAPTNLYSWQGDIAEALVFDRALTPVEMQTLWTTLAAKYALKDPPAAK
jgi:hypothetical protein